MKPIYYFLLSAVVLTSLPVTLIAQREEGTTQDELMVYIGTYTREQSKGIYAFRFQPGAGTLTPIGVVAETVNPAFLAVHPNRRFLYAVNEVSTYEGESAGSVSAFSINAGTGELTFINRVSSRGAGPCHLVVDKTGKCLLVANYGGGSVAAFPLKEDGSLGDASAFVQHVGSSVNPRRQRGPHAHATNISPDNRFAFVADLGLDQVLVYRMDPAKGTLTPNDPPFAKVDPGSGPRHMAFHPDGRYAYVLNELSSTVTAFAYDPARGSLEELETTSTLPKDFSGDNTTAEVEVHPSGRFLYGSNRGHDSIAVFAIDTRNGTLTPEEHVSTQGKTPRNFAIDPTGNYLFAANQASDNIVVFRIDRETGRLTPTTHVLDVPSPVCVTFVASH
jgi:6-phosphogluconolactonase